jgi:glycosyltransferase involved in cell wall biosynthesis
VPVIATDTPGPIGDLIQEGLIEGVPPEDPAALRATMTRLLAEPERARAMATRARAYVVERVGSDGYVETMVRYLLEAEAGTRVSTP